VFRGQRERARRGQETPYLAMDFDDSLGKMCWDAVAQYEQIGRLGGGWQVSGELELYRILEARGLDSGTHTENCFVNGAFCL